MGVLEPFGVGEEKKVGICCSGGGIRSAAFNLGALQALRHDGELEGARSLAVVAQVLLLRRPGMERQRARLVWGARAQPGSWSAHEPSWVWVTLIALAGSATALGLLALLIRDRRARVQALETWSNRLLLALGGAAVVLVAVPELAGVLRDSVSGGSASGTARARPSPWREGAAWPACCSPPSSSSVPVRRSPPAFSGTWAA